MRPIRLDFGRGAAAPRWVAPALLALAVAFAGDAGFSFVQLKRETAKSEAALARLDPKTLRPARNASKEEIALARDTVQRLSLPWDRLFGALESAASDEVALLAIEPDPKEGTVKITGDGKDYLAALTYVLNLSRADALSRVQLTRHERRNDAQKSVAFSVSAAWSRN